MKRLLLRQAVILLLDHGYKSLQIKDIARHLGVSPNTLYKLYGDKKNLVKQALLSRKALFKNLSLQIASTSHNAIEHFYELKREIEEIVSVEKQRRNLKELKQYDKKLYNIAIDDVNDIVITSFSQIIKRGKKEGVFLQNLEPKMITLIYAKQFLYFRLDDYFVDEDNLLALETCATDLFINSILTPEGKEVFKKVRSKFFAS